ncbi:MAG TPA: hypothetical protein ENN07_00410 [candidate division Zixibacteria bacterium]|nr:hypothetical protein [candidate division Zixibacteria bacterium]
MKLFASIITMAFAASALFGGMVSGTVFYDGPETDITVAACVEEGTIEIDLMTIPAAMLTGGPGPYTINEDTLRDGVNYWCMSLMLIGMGVESGNPAGMHPNLVTLTDGSATGVDITLTTSATIGGTITYGGDPGDICINIWDAYNEFMGEEAVLEETFCVGTLNYTLHDIPSGPKKIQAFADLNGNGVLDDGEVSEFFMGPFGEMVIVGGGGFSDTGIDVILGTGVAEAHKPETFKMSVTPNPFNAVCRIDAPAEVEIFDIAGKRVATIPASGTWDGTDEAGNSMPTGVYLARTTFEGKTRSVMLIYAK